MKTADFRAYETQDIRTGSEPSAPRCQCLADGSDPRCWVVITRGLTLSQVHTLRQFVLRLGVNAVCETKHTML